MDVETRRPTDLLPDREASSPTAWLAQRPGVEVVCRDRAPFFAEGAAAGAPQAVQVADRWHLWHNLSEAAERSVAQHRRCLHVPTPAAPRPEPESAPAADPSASPWPRGHRFADRIRARHAAIHALLKAGHSRRAVQRQLGMTYRTDRWNKGCTNAWKPWEEIVPLGYKGSYQRVRAYLHDKRTSPRPVTARPPSRSTVLVAHTDPPVAMRSSPPFAQTEHSVSTWKVEATNGRGCLSACPQTGSGGSGEAVARVEGLLNAPDVIVERIGPPSCAGSR
ncbi:transposase [Streptomyces sp. Inha503]|uniref:transposase n=1 Tax=Streptomyces sp. Inha503 TaxID=3383314 RepID=UPI0039A3D6FC